ncbi:MAG: replication-associated recombination protein A [Natronospirillum sp.]|uniref:replication-associated recombination protein A n=1 Tax=Natronospirillum sp. TaxID=2812955 RepID=UPI0025DB2781|nr:replication-associated recombination protein A [Natronospirillum sp.]MCH8552639.1 replication-associated recombination protein A [Natronospirillum sp.]
MKDDLFGGTTPYQPLAERMRPSRLDDYLGQSHLLGAEGPIRQQLAQGTLQSMILWGPPGVGKTTLARLVTEAVSAEFMQISAVMSGVKEIRDIIERARMAQQRGRITVLFVDEVHRFNKSQQDAFLPHVEAGTVIFIGATTENPSFELNRALLSRATVYRLQPFSETELTAVLERALKEDAQVMSRAEQFDTETLQVMARAAMGDARRALNALESVCAQLSDDRPVTTDRLAELLGEQIKGFDKGGDVFYEQISVLHKAVRGSDPDAALYWLCRMLEGGADPLYVARRVVRMASEDIGNADPRALQIAINAWDVQTRLGSPEGELTIAQAVIYMACAPKSNAVYSAFNAMRKTVADTPDYEVPMHLRNAPTGLMKDMGMEEGYRYAHDEPEAFAAGESYMPEPLKDLHHYSPADRGLESKIRAKLDHLAELNRKSGRQRYQD